MNWPSELTELYFDKLTALTAMALRSSTRFIALLAVFIWLGVVAWKLAGTPSLPNGKTAVASQDGMAREFLDLFSDDVATSDTDVVQPAAVGGSTRGDAASQTRMSL